MTSAFSLLILAAGLGKRTLQPNPKVSLKTFENKALLSYVLEATSPLNPQSTVVVVGHGKEHVEKIAKEHSDKILFATQSEQKGTGHATRCGIEALKDFSGSIMIIYGDMPLIKTESLKKLLEVHEEEKNTVTLLTTKGDSASSYGRILRDQKGFVTGIREAKDCSIEEKNNTELNAGFYIMEKAFLAPALEKLQPNNAQGELYLTDVIIRAAEEGQRIGSLAAKDFSESLGVNDLYDLHLIDDHIRQQRVIDWIKKGVQIPFPQSVLIENTVTLEQGVYIGANVELRGATSIKKGVTIDGTSIIKNATIAENAHIKLGSTIENSTIGKNTSIGPFANLRPETLLGDDVRVGNFVEIKKTSVLKGAKIPHLSYVGDAEIGENANLGAGTITCNYDGYKKSKTVVGKNAFVGSNSSLVAPVTIGEGAFVGAGSTITKDVASDSLTFTRAPHVSKDGWAKKKRELSEK